MIEKVQMLSYDKKREVEDFVDFLIYKSNAAIRENFNSDIKPGFGGGKGIIAYMSDDFDEPLDDFKDYI